MRLHPHATRVYDPRAMGLLQVKAVGLVQASGLRLPLFLAFIYYWFSF